MAVVERQERGENYHGFASRLPEPEYVKLNSWAWEHHMTFSKACAVLLKKALKAEKNGSYTPESYSGTIET